MNEGERVVMEERGPLLLVLREEYDALNDRRPRVLLTDKLEVDLNAFVCKPSPQLAIACRTYLVAFTSLEPANSVQADELLKAGGHAIFLFQRYLRVSPLILIVIGLPKQ